VGSQNSSSLVEALCGGCAAACSWPVVTNGHLHPGGDVAQIPSPRRWCTVEPERIRGANRRLPPHRHPEDCSIQTGRLVFEEHRNSNFQNLDLVAGFESGGDNLAGQPFSPELVWISAL